MPEPMVTTKRNAGATKKATKTATKDAADVGDVFLTKSEVAAMLRVNPTTVMRWDRLGKLHAFRTPGGHRRFKKSDIEAIIAGNG